MTCQINLIYEFIFNRFCDCSFVLSYIFLKVATENMNENVEKKPPKINLKQMDWMIKRAEFSLVDLMHSHLLVSQNSQGS